MRSDEKTNKLFSFLLNHGKQKHLQKLEDEDYEGLQGGLILLQRVYFKNDKLAFYFPDGCNIFPKVFLCSKPKS